MYNILFDLGNVLIDFDHRIISQRLIQYFPEERQTPTLQDELHRFIFGDDGQNSRTVEIDRGSKDINALCDNIGEQFDLNISQPAFAEIWSSIFADHMNADAIHCLNRLRANGLNVAICSNTNSAHWNALLEMQPELRQLSERVTCFLSYEIGKQKADPGFFDTIANATKSEREHHVLIDDLEENCTSAESAGMRSVLFQPNDPAKSIREINEFIDRHGWV